MPRYMFVVFTNAVEGRDGEFNDWYTNRHIPDVLTIDGFVAAQRFKLTATVPKQESAHRYLALYELDTDDLAKTQQALADASEAGMFQVTEALDLSTSVATYFTQITDRITSEKAR